MSDRLDKWKQAYDEIPIPPELKERVHMGIEAGYRQAERRPVVVWRRYLGSAAAAMLALVLLVNASPAVANAVERVPMLGAVTRVFTLRTYTDESSGGSADIAVPQVEGAPQALKQAIADYTDTIIAQYEENAAALADIDGETAHYNVDLSYTVVTDTERLFALRFDQELVTASGMQLVQIYNVDKATGQILDLGGLFRPDSGYIEAISENIKEQMHAQMESDEDVHYWLNDPDIGAENNFSAVTDDTAFYVNGDQKLVIVFNEGDVAPMYMGAVEFVIPPEVTEPLAREGFFAA